MAPLVASPRPRPNILWLTAENMGPDLACYGHPLVESPNLDRLAAAGMRYANVFCTAPVCSSSRSAFMTGLYQTATGAHNHRSHRADHFHLPGGVAPITHWLRDAGYFTANIQFIGGKPVGTGKTDLNFEVQGDEVWTRPHPPSKAPSRRSIISATSTASITPTNGPTSPATSPSSPT